MKPWQETLLVCVLGAVTVPPMLMVVLWIFGGAVETIAKHSEERDRCLKQATNGYDIERCR